MFQKFIGSDHSKHRNLNLQVEALESRTMLSSVQIFAAGDLGNEQFALQIDGETVQEFTASTELSTFDFSTTENITADQVRIQFLNDQFDPQAGIDANLRVDAVVIEGVRFETETANVFSTGTYTADGLAPGFGRGEVLHTNGYFQFANNNPQLEISARGDLGNEQFRVIVGGEELGTFTASEYQQSFFVDVPQGTTSGDVRIEFINDFYDPANGVDANLTIDFIRIDDQTFQTEDGGVFSTGTYLSEDGIVDGFGRGETLHANGFFQFSDPLILGGTTAPGAVIDPVLGDFTRNGGDVPIASLSVEDLGSNADGTRNIRVNFTNTAPEGGTFLTPVFVAIQDGTFDTFDLGSAAAGYLEALAEDGATAPIIDAFDKSGAAGDRGVVVGPGGIAAGPLDTGETGSVVLTVDPNQARFLTFASMVIPSNDAFIANPDDPTALRIFDDYGNFIGGTFEVQGRDVLDAGTEVNTERDAAFLNQTAPNTGQTEGGVVAIHPGFIGSEGQS